MSRPAWIVRESEVPGYSPANHSGTVNRRLISPETVGSRHLEVLTGTIEKGKGALPHAHPGIEQVVYLLEGTAEVELEGERGVMEAGDCCFFPADKKHIFTVTSDTPARLLVIYSPPYEENPDRVIR
ncbi:cupin domain-containing protein [Yanghanlia caeni]|uniref:Cupin domain-containing protein n=1 Tax=Yanghanlia caeni TaxID=3064283 RepID=A0ABU1D4U8_9BURK|nr:cupin domain-containing protein [Alcaligenaceae bacterium LG-2]NGR07726.1 cupin domain-containing protein [bacterium SGD-2]HZH57465.1 cupin domain-containing protein [Burkholderiaceae bacterium]